MKNNILSCIFFVTIENASLKRPQGNSASISLNSAFCSYSTIFYHQTKVKPCLFFSKVTRFSTKQPKVTTTNLYKTMQRSSLNTHRRSDDETRGFVLPV